MKKALIPGVLVLAAIVGAFFIVKRYGAEAVRPAAPAKPSAIVTVQPVETSPSVPTAPEQAAIVKTAEATETAAPSNPPAVIIPRVNDGSVQQTVDADGVVLEERIPVAGGGESIRRYSYGEDGRLLAARVETSAGEVEQWQYLYADDGKVSIRIVDAKGNIRFL